MAQRRHHYERAFEQYLRERRVPYISVDEARKSLLPEGVGRPDRSERIPADGALKSFDFVLYGAPDNLLVDVKGRRIPRRCASALGSGRLESWVTEEDVSSLEVWEGLFGPGFRGAFVFLYLCDAQPPDALFQEVFEDRGNWYAARAILLQHYREHMRVRSPRWRTVHLTTSDFERCSGPLGEHLGPLTDAPAGFGSMPARSSADGGAG